MDIQTQKTIIIERFKKIDDINLIKTIKSLLDYALIKEENQIEIPEVHQELVMERFYEAQENPESLLDWDEVKKEFES